MVHVRKKMQRSDATRARQATLSAFLERYTTWEETHRKVRHEKVIRSVFPKSWLAKPLSDLNSFIDTDRGIAAVVNGGRLYSLPRRSWWERLLR